MAPWVTSGYRIFIWIERTQALSDVMLQWDRKVDECKQDESQPTQQKTEVFVCGPSFSRVLSYHCRSCHKYHFCRDKHVFIATKHALSLSRQIIFVSTNPFTLSHTFVATKDVFYRDKSKLVRQNCFVATSVRLSRQKTCFVVTKCLSRQKWYLWQLPPMKVSKLGYFYSLVAGQPQAQMETVQAVQNTAARVMLRQRRRDHITTTRVA